MLRRVLAEFIGAHRRQRRDAAGESGQLPEQGSTALAAGRALRKSGQLDAAAASLEHAVALHPEDHRAWNELGIVELERGRTQAARASFERALALAPESAEAHCNLGIVALDGLEFDEAIGRLRRAIELDPALIEARCTLGFALYGAGQMAESERLIGAALESSPRSALARFYSSFFLLGRGEWREGWSRFEERLLASDPPFPFQYTRWNGAPVTGKRLLVCGEQGLGDQIMFASCLPDLLAQGPLCTLVLDRRLNPLLRRSFPNVQVVEDEGELTRRGAGFDYQVAIGSLPRFFRNETADFPARRAYLQADPGRVARWKHRLQTLGPGLKIGISWRGGTLNTRRALRSLDLEELALPLHAAGAHCVSLQYTDCSAELAALRRARGTAVEHWPEAIADYDETAALVSALDLVISVCTSVVHLAGALGQRAWVLAPASPEWRYGFAGESMPWYPSVTLHRQSVPGQWAPVVAALAGKLIEQRVGNS